MIFQTSSLPIRITTIQNCGLVDLVKLDYFEAVERRKVVLDTQWFAHAPVRLTLATS